MKKLLLFLSVFFFFGFLIAEDVKTGEYDFGDIRVTLFEEREPEPEKKPEPEPEKEPEPAESAPETAEMADLNKSLRENHVKPKLFYIQPAFGFGTGLSLYRPTIALNADFLVGHTPKVNFYVGLDLDLRKPMFEYDLLNPIIDSAIQTNGVVDFQVGNETELRSISIWTSFGLDLAYAQDCKKDEGCKPATLRYMPGWGTGFDFVFDNYVVFGIGLDGFLGVYPDLTLLVGYRF